MDSLVTLNLLQSQVLYLHPCLSLCFSVSTLCWSGTERCSFITRIGVSNRCLCLLVGSGYSFHSEPPGNVAVAIEDDLFDVSSVRAVAS
ncbi:uncharacterized protein G2W53_041869 [Senna tora]|uniref:Uncharacterized protein n=1 Tax=Senna tora TaxID=362788 RepID=A0A834VYF2_9FABA|nr:uncharacterized protein G2W53_041869 [Senna tora]